MKGSAYNDSVLVSQDQLRKTDQDKSSSIKERFNTLIDHGIVNDGSAPLTLNYSGGTTINISGGEAYCDFDKTNTSPEYGNTGERIYASSSLAALDVKGGEISEGDPRHFFAVYVEIHKNRKLDEVNVAHYTEKEDSYIIAQLATAELSILQSAGSIYVADNPVHANQTDLTALLDEELNDTFGSGRWDRTGSFIVDITVTDFNSVYLGTATSTPEIITDYSGTVRPTMYINPDVLNLPDIEDIAQENHRTKQHSNGISGGITAFQATVDAFDKVPDELNITDLGNDEFAYIGGHRVSTGEIANAYLSGIQATDSTYFPDGGYAYYVYVYFDAGSGTLRTTAFKVENVPSVLVSNGEENYLLIGKVFVDSGRNTIKAYDGDKRYDSGATGTANPITDLRKFGTIDSVNISDEGFSNISGDNLISNGEFEEGITNDLPNEWYGNGGILDNINLLGGKHSLLLEPSEIVLSNPIPYNQLTTYNLRVAAKAAGTSGTYTVGIRGYVGKDWSDVSFSDDATAPINISHLSTVTTESKTTSWTDSGSGIFISTDWAWTTPTGGSYSAGDLDLVKYIRVFIRNDGGSSNLYIDNIKLFDNNNVTATSTELNILDGVTATTAELNRLDGTLTDEKILYYDTTGSIIKSVDGANATRANLNTLTGGGSTALHKHTLANGATDVSASASELNRLDQSLTDERILYYDSGTVKIKSVDSANSTRTNLNTLTAGASSDADALHTHPSISVSGVTNGDSHDHSGGDGAQIPQGGLQTGLEEVSTTTTGVLLFTGGQYGFFPQIRHSSGGATYTQLFGNEGLGTAAQAETNSTTYVTAIRLGETGAGTAYAQQRYISASPPYNLGNGDIPLFIYAVIDNTTGEIESTSVAPDPCWAYNGPTIIDPRKRYKKKGNPNWFYKKKLSLPDPETDFSGFKAAMQRKRIEEEIEITQDIKNQNMPFVPHPFMGHSLTGKTVVLVDPVSSLCERLLEMHETGESVADLLYKRYLLIDNNALNIKTPPGIGAFKAKWK